MTLDDCVDCYARQYLSCKDRSHKIHTFIRVEQFARETALYDAHRYRVIMNIFHHKVSEYRNKEEGHTK
jgi:hypothetical protein